MFWLGLALFACGILVSVCLHEAGHMATAKAFGMKVTQYFAGFGPTLWSTRRGETEYGVKAIPAGGFVKIVGMTPLEPVADQDDARAFWRRPLWQRTVVLSAGSLTHFALAAVVAYAAALSTGLPNISGWAKFSTDSAAPVVQVADCVPRSATATSCSAGDPAPARAAGLRTGDRVTTVAGKPVQTYAQLVSAVRGQPAGPVTLTVQRDGRSLPLTVNPVQASRPVTGGGTRVVPVIGVSLAESQYPPQTLHYSAVSAAGGTATFGKDVVVSTFQALGRFPSRIPKLIDAIEGQPRDVNTPVSVLGASRIGGEALALGQGVVFLTLFAQLNVFIGIFNLIPLLPLDGGHIAVAWFERARSRLARHRGRPDPGRVDYEKLMPVTYAVIVVFGMLSLLTLTADIVNPIRLG